MHRSLNSINSAIWLAKTHYPIYSITPRVLQFNTWIKVFIYNCLCLGVFTKFKSKKLPRRYNKVGKPMYGFYFKFTLFGFYY